MHWLVETCVLSDERVAEFRDAFGALGITRTFTLDVDQAPELRRPRPETGADVIAYGSKSVIPYSEQMQWRPGVWSGAGFDYETVQRGLGELFLNAGTAYGALSDIETLVHQRGWSRVFLRPADDNKAFAGLVLDTDAIANWRSAQLKSGYLSDAEFNVVAASPQPLGREWRLVITATEIAGASLYRDSSGKNPASGCPAEARALALAAAERYRPAPVFIADIAEKSDGALAVVEYNAFNSADLYACDIKSVVEHVTSVAQHRDF